jgi:hypothetical protein
MRALPGEPAPVPLLIQAKAVEWETGDAADRSLVLLAREGLESGRPSFKPGVCPIRQKSAFLPVHPDNPRISPHIEVRRRQAKAGAKPLVMRESDSGAAGGSLIVVAAVAGSTPVSHP